MRNRCAMLLEIGVWIMANNKDKTFTMQEMADILKVNKTTVYRYLKKEKISPATIESNTNYYSATVMQQLKNHFKVDEIRNNAFKSPNDKLIETLQNQVQSLQEELRDEKFRSDKALEAKDRQIEELNNRLKESHQLQLGLQKKLEMIPEPKETTVVTSSNDIKVKDNNDNEAEESKSTKEADHKSGWFKKLFAKD